MIYDLSQGLHRLQEIVVLYKYTSLNFQENTSWQCRQPKSYNIIIWVECRHLDHKTYDDLPLREKISLSFVSQGISLAISGQEATAGIASTFIGYTAQYG